MLVSLIINLVYSFQEAVRFLHVGSLSNKNTYEKASQFQIGTGWPFFSAQSDLYLIMNHFVTHHKISISRWT